MKKTRRYWGPIMLMMAALSACTGVNTFTTAARPGETVALAIDRQTNLKRANVTVTITPATGLPIVYAPLDPRVRAILNLYPDPVSKAVVKQRTDTPTNTGTFIEAWATEGDPDWWQTFMLLDLPADIAPGVATVSISDSLGAIIAPASVEILTGTSTKNGFAFTKYGMTFSADTAGPPVLYATKDLERNPHAVVDFTGDTIPHAVQIEFSHTPSVGAAYVVNPRGDLKNVTWSDDGSNLKVFITPSTGLTTTQIKDFKFYVAGGLTGLSQTHLKAYDQLGVPVSGVTATITQH